MYGTGNLITFKNSIIVMHAGTISIPNTAATGTAANNAKKVIFKDCTPFAKCISDINDTQVVDAYNIDIVIPMYNLIEY